MAYIYDLSNEYGGRVLSDDDATRALTVGRQVVSNPTTAPLLILNPSCASGSVMSFSGGFISVTSILGTAATGAGIGFDYLLIVDVNGVKRGIPLTSLLSVPGAAAF